MVQIARGLRRDLVRVAFMDWFGIEAAAADVLVALWERPGGSVSIADFPHGRAPALPLTANALEVRICGLRKAMDSEAVDTLGGGLYALTEVGEAECAQALRNTAAAINRAARACERAA